MRGSIAVIGHVKPSRLKNISLINLVRIRSIVGTTIKKKSCTKQQKSLMRKFSLSLPVSQASNLSMTKLLLLIFLLLRTSAEARLLPDWLVERVDWTAKIVRWDKRTNNRRIGEETIYVVTRNCTNRSRARAVARSELIK